MKSLYVTRYLPPDRHSRSLARNFLRTIHIIVVFCDPRKFTALKLGWHKQSLLLREHLFLLACYCPINFAQYTSAYRSHHLILFPS